jgi:hypothetical protein
MGVIESHKAGSRRAVRIAVVCISEVTQATGTSAGNNAVTNG